MKTPLEKQLEKAYQIFNKNHEQLRESMLNSISMPEIEPEQTPLPQRSCLSLGQIIMSSKTLIKIAAGIVILVIIAAAFNFLTGSRSISGVAFGEVLNQIHTKSYTFDMNVIDEEQQNIPIEIKIHKSGKMRWDSAEISGGISMISDFTTGAHFILFHKPKLAANMMNIPGIDEDEIPDKLGPFDMFLNPVENLWNLRDGTETPFGEKEIENQPAIGFKIQQKEKSYSSDIIVWANKKTGFPILVEITLYNLENPSKSTKMKLDNFNLDAKLDEKLFSLEPPEGYTLAYQKTIDDTVKTTEATEEAQKILNAINLWGDGQQDNAIQTILGVDWTKPVTFADNIYFFTFTEKGYVQLKSADQQKVKQEIWNMSNQVRNLCRKILEVAETAISEKEYQKAEQYLNTILEFGKLINRDPELAYTSKIIGQSIIKNSLTLLEQLYKETAEQEKITQVQEQIKAIDTEIENLKKQISNITGG
jgi:outer membrane lipoprotein-sorting protein